MEMYRGKSIYTNILKVVPKVTLGGKEKEGLCWKGCG